MTLVGTAALDAQAVLIVDEDGLARLALRLGPEVRGCVEMMSGAVWVRDRLAACGWQVEIADARKVKVIAPLACKTDRVDARVLAELVRRDLVPEVWVRRWTIARCGSGCAGARTWSGCAPRLPKGRSGC